MQMAFSSPSLSCCFMFPWLTICEYLPWNINLSPILVLQITTQFPSLKKRKEKTKKTSSDSWPTQISGFLRNMTSFLSIPGNVANHCLTYYLIILSFLLISFEGRLSDFFEIYKHSCW